VRIRSAQWVPVLAAALLLAACSFTKLAYTNAALAYGNAAPMLTWVVGDYVDLSGSQKEWVRTRLTRAMHWHRERELPEYRAFFERVLRQSEGPFGVADLESAHRDLYARYHRMLERVLPDAAELIAQLDVEQVEHLESKFEQGDRRFLKETVRLPVDKRRREIAAKWVEHLESWVGDLDASQEELVLQHVRGFADMASERLADRRYRQREVLKLVRAKPPREQMIATLRTLFIDTHTWRSPEYLEKLKERDRQTYEMLAAVSATFTPEQRGHLANRVRGYLRDIDELTASTGSTSTGPTSGT